jgi:uncharacterized membrane protein
MKKVLVLLGVLAAGVVYAQDASQPVDTDVFVQALFTFLGGTKGMSVLAIVAGAVQLLMMFFRTSLASFTGKWSLLIVAVLSVVASVLALMSQGMTFLAALLNGATLTAVQVLGYQIYNQFVKKADEAPKA